MSHELQDGEHTDDWPEADRPLNGDDSDAPVRMDEATSEQTLDPSFQAAEPASADAADMADKVETREANTTTNGSETADEADLDAGAFADARDDDNVDITNGGVRDIDATTVSITQGGARDIDATTVIINQGGAARIRADELSVSQGGVVFARTEHLTLQDGNAFAVVADTATLDPETSVFLLIAGSTMGDVRPVMDWRAAVAFGAGFAFILSLLRRVRRVRR